VPIQRTGLGVILPPLWRDGRFRRLWGSVGVSILGSETTVPALPSAAAVAVPCRALPLLSSGLRRVRTVPGPADEETTSGEAALASS
jgi:hypothetical protein